MQISQDFSEPILPEWQLCDKGTPISAFTPSVLSSIKWINSTDGSNRSGDSVRVELSFKDGDSTEAIVPLSDLDHLDWFEVDRRCVVNSRYRQAERHIADIIRVGVRNAPEERRYVLDRMGIHPIGNTVVFAAGDRVITRSSATEADSNYELGQLPFRLDIDKSLTAKQAFEGMRELISLSPEIGPVLVAHAISGIIRAAFKKVNFTPCTVLFIVGKSGMLKSHYVPHLVQLYNRADGIGAVTRFNSTKRFIEDVLYEYSECTAVIDDLHTAESGGIKKRNEETAEEIIRRISDDIGRGRMEGSSQVQKHFCGNAVFIGEYTIGKASSIPRMLAVNLTKPPNGAILDKYQRRQPLLVSTFYYHFIQWYVDHFDDICDSIDARLTEWRRESIASGTHGRLRDAQFCLQVAYMSLMKFCKDSGFCSNEDVQDTYESFALHLASLVREQEARYRESEETKTDYLALIRELYNQDHFRVAKRAESFNPDKHDGLIHYGCLCLRGKCLDRKLKHIQSGVGLNECVNDLLSQDALKLVESKNTVQITGIGGKRFYAIWLSKLQ